MIEKPIGRIGDYQILSLLGSGGMGKVYKVRNVITDRVEAMKVLLPDLAAHPEVAERFQREIRVLAGLSHPHIAALHTAFTVGGQLIMIIEYVEGKTLSDLLSTGPLPAKEALSYVDQALDALSYAHRQQVIHRDIKPANMIVTPGRTLKLMDFGIARVGQDSTLTRTGTTMGSLHYMSPEQVKGLTIDERSDLYSLGVSLYEMVTGRRPFQADSEFELMQALVLQNAVPPAEILSSVPSWLNRPILKSIAKDPNDRFQSADAFRAALTELRTFISTNPLEMSCLNPPKEERFIEEVREVQANDPVSTHPGGWWSRGVYMALGSLIVLAVLVWAGIFVPRAARVRAGGGSSDTGAHGTVPESLRPDNSETPGTLGENGTSSGNFGTPTDGVAKGGLSPDTTSKEGAGGTRPALRESHFAERTNPVVPAAENLKIGQHDEELEQRKDQLSAQAESINQQLNALRQQLGAEGLGLRGDMAEAQELMKTHLGEAEKAHQAGDVQGAKKYLDLASQDIDKLEKFLGARPAQ